jgi:mycothiol synthase
MPQQLVMRCRNIPRGTPIILPPGYELRAYQRGDEAAWAKIMNISMEGRRTAESAKHELIGCPEFMPAGLFFVTHEGEPVGSCCAFRRSKTERRVGYLFMLGLLPEHRGRGLGKALVHAVMRFFREMGFEEVTLHTDDFRLPAIRLYLKVGFEPVPVAEDSTQEARWKAILAEVDRLGPL